MPQTISVQDIEEEEGRINQLIGTFVETRVTPYLVHLLDRIQARLWMRVEFLEGMGTDFFIFHSSNQRLNKRLQQAFQDARIGMDTPGAVGLRRNVPEIKEIDNILTALDEHMWKTGVGPFQPTVHPKSRRRGADFPISVGC